MLFDIGSLCFLSILIVCLIFSSLNCLDKDQEGVQVFDWNPLTST